MGVSILTAMTIGTNYPENIKVSSSTNEHGEKYAGMVYLMRDGQIHNILLSSALVFNSAEEAETSLVGLCEDFKKAYAEEKEPTNG
jgi:hypothetical protein